MIKVNNTSLRAILKSVWFTPGVGGRWGLPVLLVGDPGTGKSSMVAAEAQALGLCAETLIGSTCDPTDFGGYPSGPTDGSDFARMLLPQWARRVAAWQDGRGVLLLDELTCVPAAQQAAMLRLVLEGAIGSHKLDPHVRIVAAANPTEQAAGGQALAMPMANRFGHLEIEPAALDAWFSILAGEFYSEAPIDAAAIEADVEAKWDGEYRRALAFAQGFLLKRPECAQRTPRAGSPEAEEAWTSRRTWEMAIRAMAGARIHGLTNDERDTLLAAYLGHATAIEFVGWMQSADLPDEWDVLDGRTAWEPVTYRPDRTQAVVALCLNAVLKTADESLRLARGRTFWKILEAVAASTPDLAQPAIVKLATDPKLFALPEGVNVKRATIEVARAVNLGGLRNL